MCAEPVAGLLPLEDSESCEAHPLTLSSVLQVKRELAAVLLFESHAKAGTVCEYLSGQCLDTFGCSLLSHFLLELCVFLFLNHSSQNSPDNNGHKSLHPLLMPREELQMLFS